MNSKELVLELLKQIAEREKFIKFTIDIKLADLKGEGFTSEIVFASITSEFNEHLNLVVKQCISNEKIQDEFQFIEAYDNEIIFYTEIYPQIQKFQESYGVYKPLLAVPKYYGNLSRPNERLVALENLRKRGFINFDKRNLIDKTHAVSILQQYGRTHGAFLAYKCKFPEKFLDIKSKIKWSTQIFVKHPAIYKMFKVVFDEVVEFLEGSDIKKEILDRLKQYEHYQDLLEEPAQYKGKYECILHGDCLTTNMLFRYSSVSEEQKLEEVYFLDWQIMNAGTPVFDLAYFLFSGASKEIFDNFDKFLRIYYDSLSATVRIFGLDPNEVYPFSALQTEWKIHAKAVFVVPFFQHKMRLMDKDDVASDQDIQNTGDDHVTHTLKKGVTNKQVMLERIKNLVEFAFETGAL